jgi:hypothetical protein
MSGEACIIPGSAFASAKMDERRLFHENHPVWLDDHEISKVCVQ